MDCDSIRAAISASLDGESTEIAADDIIASHLEACGACGAWRDRAHELTRRARLGGYALDHDLAPRVLAALPANPPRTLSPPRPVPANPVPANPVPANPVPANPVPANPVPANPVPRTLGRRAWLRAGLALLAVAQFGITVPLLIFGHDQGAGTHAAHELGSFDLALAIAFVVGAVRPRLSGGLAWPCCIAALGLAGTAVADLISGATFGADEAQHLVAIAGALLLLWQARTADAEGSGGSALGQAGGNDGNALAPAADEAAGDLGDLGGPWFDGPWEAVPPDSDDPGGPWEAGRMREEAGRMRELASEPAGSEPPGSEPPGSESANTARPAVRREDAA